MAAKARELIRNSEVAMPSVVKCEERERERERERDSKRNLKIKKKMF